MARKSTFPSYRRHKQSGQAVVTLNDPMGRRRDVLLGPYGSPESKAEYARVIGEWQVSHYALPGPALPDITVNEVLLRFWGHVEEHYRLPDGTPTTEVENIRYALKPLRELYGHTPAGKFGPLALKAVRQRWVDAGLSRRFINQRVGRIKRMFKWAVAEELVPAAAYQALQAVEGFKQGRTAAKDRPAVQPVPAEHIDRVLPFLRPQVRAMIELQRLTGMRPGEVCRIRWGDIDQSGEVWVYRPGRHKTAYRGRPREVLIGPRGQEILRRFEKGDVQAPIFSPREGVQALHRERAKKRVIDYQPGQCDGCCRRLVGDDPDPVWQQVWELPRVTPDVTEHRFHTLTCPACGARTKARRPADLPADGYGPNLPAAVVYRTGSLNASKAQAAEVMGELLGVPLSTGQVCAIEQRAADALAPAVAELHAALPGCHVNMDETGWKEAGRTAWLWVAVTASFTVFRVAFSRGRVVVRDLLGAAYANVLTTDRWAAYNGVGRRQLCWAHLRRDFQALIDRGGAAQRVGDELLSLSDLVFHNWKRIRDRTLSRPATRCGS
jgi:integrase